MNLLSLRGSALTFLPIHNLWGAYVLTLFMLLSDLVYIVVLNEMHLLLKSLDPRVLYYPLFFLLDRWMCYFHWMLISYAHFLGFCVYNSIVRDACLVPMDKLNIMMKINPSEVKFKLWVLRDSKKYKFGWSADFECVGVYVYSPPPELHSN